MFPSVLVPTCMSGLDLVDLCSRSSLSGMGVGVVFRIGMLRSPMTTPFDFIALSLLRLMWPIHLCHSSMSESVFVLFANIISWESRMNIRPSLLPRATIRPSFSMKHPSWSNRTLRVNRHSKGQESPLSHHYVF